MEVKNRIRLVELMTEELCNTARIYNNAKDKRGYVPVPGYDFTNHESRTAIRRRIVELRAELLKLSDSL